MGHGALLGHGRGEADSKELRDLLAWKVQRTKTLAPHNRAAESLCRDQKKKKKVAKRNILLSVTWV